MAEMLLAKAQVEGQPSYRLQPLPPDPVSLDKEFSHISEQKQNHDVPQCYSAVQQGFPAFQSSSTKVAHMQVAKVAQSWL